MYIISLSAQISAVLLYYRPRQDYSTVGCEINSLKHEFISCNIFGIPITQQCVLVDTSNFPWRNYCFSYLRKIQWCIPKTYLIYIYLIFFSNLSIQNVSHEKSSYKLDNWFYCSSQHETSVKLSAGLYWIITKAQRLWKFLIRLSNHLRGPYSQCYSVHWHP